MAKILTICKCSFLILAIITCFQVLCAEGRPFKSIKKQELDSLKKDSLKEMAKQGNNTNLHHSTANDQKASQPAPPSHNPSAHGSMTTEKKEMSPPMVPTRGDSAADYIDDFRPTTPGYSPGVGHPKTPRTGSNTSTHEHSVTDFKDDFRPTTPGHSPGVGNRLLEDENDQDVDDPKAPAGCGISSSIEHSVKVSTNDYRPTNPGHSPGVGHVFQNKNEERKA